MSDANAEPPGIIGICVGHAGTVTALHFINESDNVISEPSLISGSDTGEILIWNLKTKRTYHRLKDHDGKMILYLCYYKSSLISQGRDGSIHVWKFTNDEWNKIRSFKSSAYGFCTSVLFPTESNTYLVVPTGDQSSLSFYDYETSEVLNNYTHETENREICMCIKIFMEEKKIFVLLGYDSGNISLWDCEENEEKYRLKCHPEVVLCLDFDSMHKKRGISGSVDNKIQVWKKNEDNQLLRIHEIPVTNPGITAVRIRQDGKLVFTGGQDGNVRIFSWKSLKPLSVICSHRQPIFSLECRTEPFGRKNAFILASGSKDKNITLGGVYF